MQTTLQVSRQLVIVIQRVQSAFVYRLSIYETVLSVNADVVEYMT